MGWYLDVFAAVILLLIVYKGYENGVVLAFIGIITFFASYFLSYTLAVPAGNAIHDATGLYRFVAVPAGGLAVFFVINILSFLPKFIYKRIMRTKVEDKDGNVKTFYKPHTASRVIAVGLMLPVGLFMVSFIYWGGNALSPEDVGMKNRIMAFPAKKLLEVGLATTFGEDDDLTYSTGQLTELITNPSTASEKISDVLREPTVQQLMHDTTLLNDIRSGNPDLLLKNRGFRKLLSDDEAMLKLHRVGMVSDDYKDPDYAKFLALRLSEAGIRMRNIENDPGIKELVSELQSGGGLTQEKVRSIITDKRFLKLVDGLMYGK